MMAAAVTDLEGGLQAMLNLKPPGVSGSRITSLTSLCVSNIQVILFSVFSPYLYWLLVKRDIAQQPTCLRGIRHHFDGVLIFLRSLNPYSSKKSTHISKKLLGRTSWGFST